MKRVAAATTFLMLICLFATCALAANIATARKLSGDVTHRSGEKSNYATLVAGAFLAEGNWLRTGKNGWIELALTDGSTLTLANNSERELTHLKLGTSQGFPG
jgi:hypothetical protein